MAIHLRRPASRLLVAGLVVVVVAVVSVVLVVRSHHKQNDLQQAMSWALKDGRRFAWTDWSDIRSHLHASLSTDSTPAELNRFLSQGYDADLTSTSALLSSARVLQDDFDFSPASVSWELYTQAQGAAVEMLKLGPGNDVGQIQQALRTDGYAEPGDPDGIWSGDQEAIKRLGELTPEFSYIAIEAHDRLILSSDTLSALQQGLKALHAGGSPVQGVGDVVDSVGTPYSAAIYSSDQVCGALAMSQAGSSDAAAGEQLIAQAGKVSPLAGFAMADESSGDTLVAMSFDSDDQASSNARTRAILASGPAPGQGGTFGERYRLGRVEASGRVLTMVLHPRAYQSVLSDLSNGPLLFATC